MDISLRSVLLCVVTALATPASPVRAQSEIPPSFAPNQSTSEYTIRRAEIPMRDGVTLRTVIIVPRGATHAPILLSRTPYNAESRARGESTPSLADLIGQNDTADDAILDDGDIRVIEDVRGKYGSQGAYLMIRHRHKDRSTQPAVNGSPKFGRGDHWRRHQKLSIWRRTFLAASSPSAA